MRFHGLDLNLLVALDALVAHQNVTRAARQLFISQSAMSGALARLREHFNDDLIVKSGRRMTLTPLAESLAQPLREVLSETTRLVKTRSAFDPAKSDRRYKIGCSDYVWTMLISEVLRRLAVEAPHVELWFAGTEREFEKSDIDLLIVPDRFAGRGHPNEVLFAERYVCIAWTRNSLLGKRLTQPQYLSMGHVVSYSWPQRRDFIGDWFHRLGKPLKTASVTPSYTLLPISVVGTNYLALVPERLARYYAKTLPLRILEPPVDIPAMTSVLQWHSYQNSDPGMQWMRATIKSVAQQVFGPHELRLAPGAEAGPRPRRHANAYSRSRRSAAFPSLSGRSGH
jgi:LysR family transcriptional regulator, nod-box dependent transcriptional activator